MEDLVLGLGGTLSFGSIENFDESVAKADAQFKRREFRGALATLAEVPELFQSRVDLLEIKARSHQALGQPSDAIAAWEHLLRVDPLNKAGERELPACYAQLGTAENFRDVNAHIGRGKFRDALTSLDALPPSFRGHPEYHRLRARCFENLSDYESALTAWGRLLALVPSDEEGQVWIGTCHAALGHIAEAEQALEAAVTRFPHNMRAQFEWLFFRLKRDPALRQPVALMTELRSIASLSESPARFEAQLDRFRTRLLSLDDIGEWLAREIERGPQPAPTTGTDESLRSIYERFEPVGDNCEFGFAQRNAGAEPLSLFRWTSITPENLIRLLEQRFDNFDALQCHRVEQGPDGEFILKESTYQTSSHTMLKPSDANGEASLQRLCRRQAFLQRKFLETAAEGRKIFVYKYDQRLSPELMDGIEQGLSQLGARKFLFVMRAAHRDEPGSVRVASPRRVLGFLSDFMPATQFAQWDSIVRQAHEHFRSA